MYFKKLLLALFFSMIFSQFSFGQCNANSQASLQTCMNGTGFGDIQLTGSFQITTSVSLVNNRDYVITTNGFQVSWTPPLAAFTGGNGNTSMTVNGSNTYFFDGNNPPTFGDLNAQGVLDAGLLPVELLSFTGKYYQPEGIVLEWVTGSESYNEKFVVENSLDGKSFLPIGEMQGAGSSLATQVYRFVHPNPSAGVQYYRLRQVDFDGTEHLHKVIALHVGGRSEGMRIFPNPAILDVNLEVHVWAKSNGLFSIFNAQGVLLKSIEAMPADISGDGRILISNLDISFLPKGSYWIVFENGVDRFCQTFFCR